MARSLGIGWFAREVLDKPLYWYQELIGDAVLDSIRGGHGRTFTVLMARQSGKNQLSAVLEAYLLCMWEQGSIVKAAPTYKPQVINSKQRLLHMLDMPGLRSRLWKAHGYMIGLAADKSGVETQSGARVLFFSAGPEAHIVGATASLLLEIDEAQDVAPEKYDVDLKPMASTTNATTILYGTAWSDTTLLARMSSHNQELELQDGIRRHFAFDWTTLAAINPHYHSFVQGEIERLGKDHLSIRTQYRLLPISGAGYLLNELQRYLLHGSHAWQTEPTEDDYYIAGMDIGGEEERATSLEGLATTGKRDSTVITISRVCSNELDLPCVEVVHQCWFTGMKYLDQYATTCELMRRWNIRRLVIDRTGLGDGLASLLREKFGEERITGFRFTRPSKSALTFQFLGMINSGRFKIYAPDLAPFAIYEECWQQLTHARYSIPGEGLMNMYCDASNNMHDDFLCSLALCCEAIRETNVPIQPGSIIIPKRLYEDGQF